MNILFLTLNKIDDINQRGIYPDLLRVFISKGHKVFIVSPLERKLGKRTQLEEFERFSILIVRTLNIQKTNIIEKGLGTLSLEFLFNRAIEKYFKNIKFDLILYSTPPITLTNLIGKIKRKNNSKTYLLLKDIFPQNAVDIGIISESGLLYRYFRNREKQLYRLSDYIGCMSPANVKYILKNNPEISPEKIEVCPNSVELFSDSEVIDRLSIKKKYGIPEDNCTFIYGGNLGKPQGLDFLLKVLESNKETNDCYFIIAGSGTEYSKVANWFEVNKPNNALLLKSLPKNEYDVLIKSCDVGLIFLDPRFTIPNYPSRLLSYMENKMPVLMATDINSDIGPIAEENGYGFWCENGNITEFNLLLERLVSKRELRIKMGKKGYEYLLINYQVQRSAEIILSHL